MESPSSPSRPRALLASVILAIAFASFGLAACGIGPKQEDPAADEKYDLDSGTTGGGSDTNASTGFDDATMDNTDTSSGPFDGGVPKADAIASSDTATPKDGAAVDGAAVDGAAVDGAAVDAPTDGATDSATDDAATDAAIDGGTDVAIDSGTGTATDSATVDAAPDAGDDAVNEGG